MPVTPRTVVLFSALSLLSLPTAASADERHPRMAQTKKGDRSKPPPAPPVPPPAPAAAPAAAPPPSDPSAPLPPPAPPPATMAPAGDAGAAAPLPPPIVTTTTRSAQLDGYNGRRRAYDEDRFDDESRRPNWLLFGVGTGLFAVAWIATGATTMAICGDAKCNNSEEAVAWIPLAGPAVVGAVGKPSGGQIAALTAAFLSQTAGFTLAVVGLATTVPDRPARRSLYVAPQLGATANGMVLGGTF